MFNNQEPFLLVIFSSILITLMFDSGLILLREIRCWSILGAKGLIYRHYKAFVLLHFKKIQREKGLLGYPFMSRNACRIWWNFMKPSDVNGFENSAHNLGKFVKAKSARWNWQFWQSLVKFIKVKSACWIWWFWWIFITFVTGNISGQYFWTIRLLQGYFGSILVLMTFFLTKNARVPNKKLWHLPQTSFNKGNIFAGRFTGMKI